MTTRGRGKGRGRGHTMFSSQPTQSPIDRPLPDPALHSPGATSNNDQSVDGGQLADGGQSAGGGQSSATTPLIDNASQIPVDPEPTVEPSSVDSPNEVDRRLVLAVEDITNPKRFDPDVTRDIVSDLLMRMPEPAENWNKYCPNMKEMLFNNFMEKYRFKSNYDRSMARTIWDRTCKDRFSDSLARARERARQVTGSDNVVDYKGHGPRGMRTEIWDGLIDIWNTPKWQNKSVKAKMNRAAKPDAMVHTGGSRSFGKTLKKMEAEHKRPITYSELYSKVHKKSDGEYVSSKAKNFIESYENAITEKYGEDKSKHPRVDSDVWKQVAGENKKGRIHGMGHSLELISGSPQGSSSTVIGPSSTTRSTEDITAIATQMSQMQEQMQAQLQIHTQALQQSFQTQMQTQIADMQLQMQAQLQAQMQAQMQAQLEFFRKEILPAFMNQTPPSDKNK